MPKHLAICLTIIIVAVAALLTVVVFCASSCQRDIAIERAKQGYAEYGPGTIVQHK